MTQAATLPHEARARKDIPIATGFIDYFPDALMRHFVERGGRDGDGARHSAKVAWRALAMLQKEIEADRKAAAELEAQGA